MSSFGYSVSQAYFALNEINSVLTPPDSISDNFSITIAPYWYDRASLMWTVPSEWGSVTYNIYAGPTEVGPFSKLNLTRLTSPQFEDDKLESYSKFEKRWYIIEAVFPNTKKIQSNPTTWDNKGTTFVNLRIREVHRREWLLLRKFTGIDTYLFRRKNYGTRCPDCYNQDTKRITKDKCLTCFGTSWEGGYYAPMRTLLQYDPTPNDVSLTYSGKSEPNQIQAWTIAYPEIMDLDLIYRVPDKKVYRVERVSLTELAIKSVRQMMVLVELSKESVEHKLIQRYE